MSVQVYSVSDQNEGRRKVFLEWTGIDLSSKLSHTCRGSVNYHKTVLDPITNLPVKIGNNLATLKTNQ